LALPLLASCGSEQDLREQTNTDTFGQAQNNLVDILWVIDDSNSMQKEQDLLAGGFAAFADAMEQSNTDFQLGVISTSFDENGGGGVLVGDPPYLTTADTDYKEAFVERAQLGTGGSDKEKGLEAATFALGPTMVYGGGPNEGFLRADAQLLVIFVSDEEDCSDRGALGNQPSDDCYLQADKLAPTAVYIQELRDLKDDRNDINVGAIVGLSTSTCDEVEASGDRYAEVALAMGGLVGDLCSADWSGIMGRLGLNAGGIRESFKLTKAAQPDTLVVYVDETEIPNDPTNGYTYDESSWFITFHGDAIPPRGSSITAEYTVIPGVDEPEVEVIE
jgi:hypothetical protein